MVARFPCEVILIVAMKTVASLTSVLNASLRVKLVRWVQYLVNWYINRLSNMGFAPLDIRNRKCVLLYDSSGNRTRSLSSAFFYQFTGKKGKNTLVYESYLSLKWFSLGVALHSILCEILMNHPILSSGYNAMYFRRISNKHVCSINDFSKK